MSTRAAAGTVYEGTPEFRQLLDESGYRDILPMPGGRYVGLHRLMYHWSMIVGRIDDMMGYETRYCYSEHYALAKYALIEWAARGFEGEPIGWHRHPNTGRRRPDGDPTREYIAG